MENINRTLAATEACEFKDPSHADAVSEALDASIRARVQNMMRLIVCTSGVPMGIRSILAEKCAELQQMLVQEELDLNRVAWKIHEIVQASACREELLANEGLMLNVDLLDMAMSDYRKSLMMAHAPVHQQAM